VVAANAGFTKARTAYARLKDQLQVELLALQREVLQAQAALALTEEHQRLVAETDCSQRPSACVRSTLRRGCAQQPTATPWMRMQRAVVSRPAARCHSSIRPLESCHEAVSSCDLRRVCRQRHPAGTGQVPVAVGDGIPLVVAKRLGGNMYAVVLGDARLSGVPMRQTTVGAGAHGSTTSKSALSGPDLSGVPLARAKRL
jgi:hypothetical protein